MPKSKTIRRILSSGFKAGSAALSGERQATQDKEKARLEKNKALMAELLGYARIDESEARTNKLLNPPVKAPSIGDLKGQAAQAALASGDMDSYNILMGITSRPTAEKDVTLSADTPGGKVSGSFDQASEAIKLMGGVSPDQSKNITGIGDFEDIVSGRQEESDQARYNAAIQIIEAFPDLFKDEDGNLRPEFMTSTPEQLAEYAKSQNDPTKTEGKGIFGVGSLFGQNREVPNPEFENVERLLGNINIPGKYETPVGDAATALGDSAQAARTDPNIAALLMGGGSASQETGKVPSVQEFAEALKQGKAQGKVIDWDLIAQENPGVDIEALKRMVGE